MASEEENTKQSPVWDAESPFNLLHRASHQLAAPSPSICFAPFVLL